MAGSSVEDVLKRAKKTYVTHRILEAKVDKRKRVTRSQKARGYTKYYRVYLMERR